MVESKLILLTRRTPLPDELGIDPPSRRHDWKNMSFYNVMILVGTSWLLWFGSLATPIQKVAIHIVPTIGIAFMMYIVTVVSTTPIGFYGAISVSASALSYLIYLLLRPHQEDSRMLRRAEERYYKLTGKEKMK